MLQYIKEKEYKHLNTVDKDFLLLQEGFLYQLKGNDKMALQKYELAIASFKKNNPCELALAWTKIMYLYGEQKNFSEAENWYQKIMRNADSCNVIQYKIHATEVLMRMFDKNNLSSKGYYYAKKLDTLNAKLDESAKLSQLHLAREKQLKEQLTKDNQIKIIVFICFLVFVPLLSCIAFYFIKKKEKTRYEGEIVQLQKELSSSIGCTFSNTIFTGLFL